MFGDFKLLALLCLSVFFLSYVSAEAASERPVESANILFIMNADSEALDLWHIGLVENSQAAAKDLGVNLEYLFVGTDRSLTLRKIENRMQYTPTPDYIIFSNTFGLGVDILKLAEANQVQSFLFIDPLSKEEYLSYGGPRENFKYWIGELTPDDVRVGYDLANFLIAEAQTLKEAREDTSPVKLIAITGHRSSTASRKRKEGFLQAVSEHDDIRFLQSVSARWQGEVANEKYKFLQMRYGEIDVVWSANDSMALGIVEATKVDESPPLLGGVDWISPAIEAIRNDSLKASMGGHSFDIAYVIAILNLHHKGDDFSQLAGTPSLKSKLVPMTKAYLPVYDLFLEQKKTGRIDYANGFAALLKDKETFNDLSLKRFIDFSLNDDMQNISYGDGT